jgi:hypothetical protein
MVFSWLWYSIINVTLLLMEMISTQVHLKCSLAYRKCPFFVCIKYMADCAALLKNLLKHILLPSQMFYNYSGVQLQYHVVT